MLQNLLSRFAATCTIKGDIYGIPTWYKYLEGETDLIDSSKCLPKVNSFDQIPAIGLGIVDILLHIAGILAIGYVVYGGFLYITSQGEPDRTAAAKSTLMNAVIGIIIVLIGISIVSFVGRSF